MEHIRLTKWITPFSIQVFVVIGASIHMSQLSFAAGFTARLIPQLQSPDSSIPVEDSTASWIASTFGITTALGNILVPFVMGKFGRRPAGIFSNILVLIGWIWVSLATSATSIIIARTLQGLGIGIAGCVASTTIGECCSPAYRPAFLAMPVFQFALSSLLTHTLGSFTSWQVTAMIIASLTFADLIILILSPESPSWLADQGRYEECRKNFRLLRGINEDDELEKLIEASKLRRNNNLMQPLNLVRNKASSKLASWINFVKLREIYIPSIIMFNIYVISIWCGLPILLSFTEDLIFCVLDPNTNVALHIFLTDLIRLLICLIGIYLAKKFRRRLLFPITVGANIVALVLIAMYSYARAKQLLPFDSSLIGITLLYLLVTSATWGASTFSVTLSAEILPLEFRSLLAGLCKVLMSINVFITLKSFRFLVNSISIQGTLCLYAFVTTISFVIVMIYLPETKDKTLQEIENEIKGNNIVSKENQVTPLTTKTAANMDE